MIEKVLIRNEEHIEMSNYWEASRKYICEEWFCQPAKRCRPYAL